VSRIVGIGLDVVDLRRFARLLERHGPAALRRICRDGEVRIAEGPGRIAHVAGLFAAKEATMKALGTGWTAGVGFHQIEVARRAGGAPELVLHGAALERCHALGADRCHLSITHDTSTAAAVVVLEGAGPETRG